MDSDGATAGLTPRLYERVYDILAAEIGQGHLPAQSVLSETMVAARFGISRAPARRALAELEQTGLLRRAARGYGVLPGASATEKAPSAAHTRPEPKLVSLPSWERIYAEVESEIIARTSFATWRVNEAEIARHYRVSRTVARDVIGRLQQRGVVQKDDRARWYAPALTSDHVSELYELRWLLEPVALVKAAPNLPAGVVEAMQARLGAALANASAVGGETLDALERDLHVSLLSHCRNRALMQAITYPQSLLIAHRFLYRWTARMFESEPFLPEHLAIVERVLAGQAEEAAGLLEAHLRVSRDRAIARIDVIAGGPQPDPLSYLERMS